MAYDPIDILHKAGLRRTPVRTGVLEQLAAAKRPMSVADIARELPRGTDVVTVYRTLNTLAEKGLARRLHGDDRTWLYELIDAPGKSSDHVHAHFVCDECGTVECLPDVPVPPLPRGIIKSDLTRQYDVAKQEYTLHGRCPKCH